MCGMPSVGSIPPNSPISNPYPYPTKSSRPGKRSVYPVSSAPIEIIPIIIALLDRTIFSSFLWSAQRPGGDAFYTERHVCSTSYQREFVLWREPSLEGTLNLICLTSVKHSLHMWARVLSFFMVFIFFAFSFCKAVFCNSAPLMYVCMDVLSDCSCHAYRCFSYWQGGRNSHNWCG